MKEGKGGFRLQKGKSNPVRPGGSMRRVQFRGHPSWLSVKQPLVLSSRRRIEWWLWRTYTDRLCITNRPSIRFATQD